MPAEGESSPRHMELLGPASGAVANDCTTKFENGRKLTLRYSGTKHDIPRYSCSRGWLDNDEPRCIAFGGLQVDDAVADAILTVLSPGAVAAAIVAEKEASQRCDQVSEALQRDLEAARYAGNRAFQQYDAADPANRLVTDELEARRSLIGHVRGVPRPCPIVPNSRQLPLALSQQRWAFNGRLPRVEEAIDGRS